MGMNIHIEVHPTSANVDWSTLDNDDATLPRYVDSYDFMSFIWKNCESVKRCACPKDDCWYVCDGDSIVRPRDFDTLKQYAKTLNHWALSFAVWLEKNPAAYLRYD